jgi:hypothetical protein
VKSKNTHIRILITCGQALFIFPNHPYPSVIANYAGLAPDETLRPVDWIPVDVFIKINSQENQQRITPILRR